MSSDPRMTTLASFREATGSVRPPGRKHNCPPAEIVWGLWTAQSHDIDTRAKLLALVPLAILVVNAASDVCARVDYGDGIRTVVIEGLLGDPVPLNQVNSMQEGPEKEAARAALPEFSPEERAGDARKDFDKVNELIDGVLGAGGDCLIHCQASLSRSVVFILAYMMRTHGCSAAEAVRMMKPKWDAVWPNDTFVNQLIAYEAELVASIV
jgi:hypothetical protein